jgi:hypothetical protein
MKSRLFLYLAAIALLPGNLFSQNPIVLNPQKKIALVIGNGNYMSSILANPENDANSMKIALESLGFIVMKYENLNQNDMKRAIDNFGTNLKNYEVGLFFYAGHGIQSNGNNYLIPVDAELKSEEDVELNCVEANRVLAKMEASGSKVNIVILDACRNNPFERSWTRASNGKGLAFMDAPGGTLIAYSTSPGKTASDGSGNNSPYTSAILESIRIPDITIIEMFQNVRSIVSQKSGKQQIPWESTSLIGNFYFNSEKNDSPGIQNTIPSIAAKDITQPDEKTTLDLNVGKPILPSVKSISIQVKSFGLLEIDYERFIGKKLSTSVGLNIMGGNLALKYHFKPQINSSSIGLLAGAGNDILEKINPYIKVVPFIEFRTRKLFTCSIGVGFLKGDFSNSTISDVPSNKVYTYADIGIGLFFPVR